MKKHCAAYFALTKPGIVTMVLVTTAIGYLLGSYGSPDWITLAWTLLGTACTAAGGAALNHYIERDFDKCMTRTSHRPLVVGSVTPAGALLFGSLLVVIGIGILAHQVNYLTSFLSCLTAALYLFLYTPLKRVTGWNTFIGAIPGALPPVGGWTAATGSLNIEAFFLFLILFVWQHPHFFAIAWLYRDDYNKAGMKMLPCIDTPDMKRTARQTLFFSCLLVPVSILPAASGFFTSSVYLAGAVALSVMMLLGGIAFSNNANHSSARALLFSSLIYLPALFICIIFEIALLSF